MTQNEQALSFGRVAPLYDSIRPSYPIEAARWALGPRVAPGQGVAVDLGAGTGLLTRILLPLAGTVIPVEPDAGMRTQLESSLPGMTTVAGTAESMPLPDSTVDSVVCGQAYHWFDHARAHAEIGRVVRSGGSFTAVWNLRDDTIDWVVRLHAAMGAPPNGHVRDPRRDLQLDFGPDFEPAKRAEFRHEVPMDREKVHTLAASRSNYVVADSAVRAEIDARVAAVTAELPDAFSLPYVTVCYRAIRR